MAPVRGSCRGRSPDGRLQAELCPELSGPLKKRRGRRRISARASGARAYLPERSRILSSGLFTGDQRHAARNGAGGAPLCCQILAPHLTDIFGDRPPPEARCGCIV